MEKTFLLKNIIWVWATPMTLGALPILFPCEVTDKYIHVLDNNETISNENNNGLKNLTYYCTHYYNLNPMDLRFYSSYELYSTYLKSTNSSDLSNLENKLFVYNNLSTPKFKNFINKYALSFTALSSYFRKRFYNLIDKQSLNNNLKSSLYQSFAESEDKNI